MEQRFSTKDLILDITTMKSRAEILLEKNAKYSSVLKVILNSFDYYNEIENIPVPSIKSIGEKTGLSTIKIKQHIQEIHKVLNDTESVDEIPFSFSEVTYEFHLKGFFQSTSFSTNKLPVIPRKGENINIPFFKSITGTTSYFVSDIQHHFQDNKQVILIILKIGSYSPYWELRKSQGFETKKLAWDDYKLFDFEQKEKLNIYKEPWG